MPAKSDVPFSAQFSPEQTPLPRLLGIVASNAGGSSALIQAIADAFFAGHQGSPTGLAKNTIWALRAYRILTSDDGLTPFGEELVALAGNESELYARLARHILVNLRGLEVANTLLDMQRAHIPMNLTSIREALEEHGLHMPKGGTHFSGMKGWLQMAGVVDAAYTINQPLVERLIGGTLEEADTLATVARPLRDYVRALVHLAPNGPLPSNQVAVHANRLYGSKYPDKSLPKFLDPLVQAGLITLHKTTSGRGAKPHDVTLTPRAEEEMLIPLLDAMEQATGVAMRFLWAQSLAEILTEVRTPDTYVKGRALEALAIYLTRLLDLKFRFWRLRSQQATGGQEVDVVVEGDRFIFSRWQIQCKNTGTVRLDDVAKEVGLSFQFKSNVILMVTTGSFASDARKYADFITKTTNLQVALIAGDDLAILMEEPTRIADMLDRETQRAMELKRIEVEHDG